MKQPKTEPYAVEVVSSCIVGPGFGGTADLFTAPLGSPTVRWGSSPPDLFPAMTPLLTNMTKLGETGPAIGDCAFRLLRFDAIGATAPDLASVLGAAEFTLLVAAKVEAKGGLRDLPRNFDPPILVRRSDELCLRLEAASPVSRKGLPITAPFVLRAILEGTALRDVR